MSRRFTRSKLTCLCLVAACAATTMAQGARTVVVNVHGPNGFATPDASVAIRTIDGQMTEAAADGIMFAVKNVGEKVTIDATHPVFGSDTVEADLPMVNPVFVEVHFTARNRAYMVMLDRGPGPVGPADDRGRTLRSR